MRFLLGVLVGLAIRRRRPDWREEAWRLSEPTHRAIREAKALPSAVWPPSFVASSLIEAEQARLPWPARPPRPDVSAVFRRTRHPW